MRSLPDRDLRLADIPVCRSCRDCQRKYDYDYASYLFRLSHRQPFTGLPVNPWDTYTDAMCAECRSRFYGDSTMY